MKSHRFCGFALLICVRASLLGIIIGGGGGILVREIDDGAKADADVANGEGGGGEGADEEGEGEPEEEGLEGFGFEEEEGESEEDGRERKGLSKEGWGSVTVLVPLPALLECKRWRCGTRPVQ
ncbi:hypothetical protein RIF29_21472 [Crotalaria pallida]|uniref:Uncharacterized protein n=1 Tax=Crotalaria pallida TaxID=3830 RepID=A0AAN9I8G0_CROPI